MDPHETLKSQYFTILSDLKEGTVYEVLPGRKTKDIEDWFKLHAEDFKKVTAMTMDMSKTYTNLANKFLSDPDNQLGFDKFHVIMHANEAVDKVRKGEQREFEGGDEQLTLFRKRYLFLHSKENVPANRQEEFEQLKKIAVKTSKAWAIKESLRDLWNQPDEESITQYFKKWFWWATHSRLKPVQKMAHTLNDHFQGILTAIRLKITNAVAEGLNSKIEKIKRDAYGYRNKDKLRTAIMFHCGGLDLYPKPA
jgi:transposase